MGPEAPTVEGFNYPPAGLRTTFDSYFDAHPEETEQLGRTEDHEADRQGIANRVYGGRYGNENPGDGWRYRGRGMFHTTFRASYQSMTEAHRNLFGEYIDFVSRPELLAEPKYAARAAVIYWMDHEIPVVADQGISQDTFNSVRRIVNPGEGRKDREDHWTRVEALQSSGMLDNVCEFSLSHPRFSST
jgi:predicted chitinase